ncbi:ABC transporter permease [Sediminibacillus halophilus]|uniref:Putative spermidine/putrescine transport system permease protein n=1 Tax=Sediminibacillus halophilus TaxID=482461 RepID=A0A1G9U6Z6_9BACI|nr:ABC transporter permease subunit [Sediminibacillus halophilus]SDM55711.1 putative spermidine/putrescine transport system permease protein [Sediminibacillus halophilus]
MNQEVFTRKRDYLLLLPSLLPLLLLFVYPLLKGFVMTFQEPGSTAVTLSNYIEFFTNAKYYDTIWRTLYLVVPAAILELFLAFGITYFIRGKMKGGGLIAGLTIFPLTLGSIIIDMAVIAFFKPTGWFNTTMINIGILDEPFTLVYNYWGAFIALIILGVAFIASNLVGMMDSIDPNLEKAARTLGASHWVTFKRVFWPLIRSNVLTVFALNLIMQIGVYSTAVIVGNPASETRTFVVVAFEEAMRNFNYNMANTVAIVMGVTQLLVLAIVFAIRKRGFVGSASTFK